MGAYPAEGTGIHDITHSVVGRGRFQRADAAQHRRDRDPDMHDGSVATLEGRDRPLRRGRAHHRLGAQRGVGARRRCGRPRRRVRPGGFILDPRGRPNVVGFSGRSPTDVPPARPALRRPFGKRALTPSRAAAFVYPPRAWETPHPLDRQPLRLPDRRARGRHLQPCDRRVQRRVAYSTPAEVDAAVESASAFSASGARPPAKRK